MPVWSADLADRHPERTFYFTNKKGKVDHTGLVYNLEVFDFVKRLINDNPSCSGYENIKPNIQ